MQTRGGWDCAKSVDGYQLKWSHFLCWNLFHRHKRLLARKKCGWRLSISLCVMSKPYVEHLGTIIRHTILRRSHENEAKREKRSRNKIQNKICAAAFRVKWIQVCLHLERGNDSNAAALGWLRAENLPGNWIANTHCEQRESIYCSRSDTYKLMTSLIPMQERWFCTSL
jgi:hypothetical protein